MLHRWCLNQESAAFISEECTSELYDVLSIAQYSCSILKMMKCFVWPSTNNHDATQQHSTRQYKYALCTLFTRFLFYYHVWLEIKKALDCLSFTWLLVHCLIILQSRKMQVILWCLWFKDKLRVWEMLYELLLQLFRVIKVFQ